MATADKSLVSKNTSLVRKNPIGERRASDVGLDGELKNSLTLEKEKDAYKTNKPGVRTSDPTAAVAASPMEVLKFNNKKKEKRKTTVPLLSDLTNDDSP